MHEEFDLADLHAIAVGQGCLRDDRLAVEEDWLRGGEFADAQAIGPANDLRDDRRQIGAGDAQIAAGNAADEEFLGGDIVPRRSSAALPQLESHQRQLASAGRHMGGWGHAKRSIALARRQPGTVTIRATRPRFASRRSRARYRGD